MKQTFYKRSVRPFREPQHGGLSWCGVAALLLSVGICWSQPTINRQPLTQSVSVGANPSFLVSATTTNPPITYQWRLETTNLPGATRLSLNLTNVQLSDAGDYDVVAFDGSGSVTSRVAHLEVDPTFTKITTGDVVAGVGTGVACAWGDYDGDGFIDLFVTSAADPTSGTLKKNLLFHNNRNGTFTQVTNGVLATDVGDWRGCSWADYDNDGFLDLLVTRVDGIGFPDQAVLYRNNGKGTFTRMSGNIRGGVIAGGSSEGCIWADYDNDGFLDIFVSRRTGSKWLLHNGGDGIFALSNTVAGVLPDSRDSHAGIWGDYDGDGWPDLFVAIEDDQLLNQTNVLYLNNRNGTFSPVLNGSVVTDNDYSGGGAWVDYDNDGRLDLFVVNGVNFIGTNCLYHNNGGGDFTKMTSDTVGTLLSDPAAFAVCAWGDYDNDGFIDVFITAFGLGNSLGTNYLYHNNGDGSFTRILSGSLVNDPGQGVGCAWGDYDNDGFLDLVVVCGGDFSTEANLLYRNNGNSNAWLKINLVGRVSNRSGLGAKVRVYATIRGRASTQLREINTGEGFGASPLTAHFGLGDATNIDLVRIEWPSGIVQTLTNVAPRQSLTVVEHQEGFHGTITLTQPEVLTNGTTKLLVQGDPGPLYAIEASTNLLHWTKVASRTNTTGVVEFIDSKSASFRRRFYRALAP